MWERKRELSVMRKQFEYMSLVVESDKTSEPFNKLGLEGWELVAMFENAQRIGITTAHFKRALV